MTEKLLDLKVKYVSAGIHASLAANNIAIAQSIFEEQPSGEPLYSADDTARVIWDLIREDRLNRAHYTPEEMLTLVANQQEA